MKLLAHPNLVPMLGHFTEEHIDGGSTFHLVLPYYAGGDLLEYLRKKRSLPESEARHYWTQMCHAVNHMHTSGLIHRDLKLENFFLSSDGRHCYVGDFGFAGTWSRDKMQNKSWGSIHYAAPEICSSAPYLGPEVDVWSLGVILYALLCGKLPFNGENDFAIYQQIITANPPFPPSVSSDAISLIKAILNPNRATRTDMREILAHPWMQLSMPASPTTPHLERHKSSDALVTPLNMERLHQRRGSNSVAINNQRRSSVSGSGEEELRSPSSSSASSSPKSAGSRFDSPGSSPRDVSRRPSRFINLSGGRRFSISSLASKLVHAVSPGRAPSPSTAERPPAASERSASPNRGTPPSSGGVFPIEQTP